MNEFETEDMASEPCCGGCRWTIVRRQLEDIYCSVCAEYVLIIHNTQHAYKLINKRYSIIGLPHTNPL